MQGEQRTLTMELCFGKKCKASTFRLESFNDVLMSLYEPSKKQTN